MPNARDRVKCSTATTGTGTVALGAAVPGYRTFTSAYAATTIVSYSIDDGVDWETGIGTFDKTANTLSRTTRDASSTGSALNLSGSAVVAVAILARESIVDFPVLIVGRAQPQGNGGFQNVSRGGGFTTIQLNASPSVDTHNGFSTSSFLYTVPQSGVYDMVGKIRPTDNAATGIVYGVGIDIANRDSARFVWNEYPTSPAPSGDARQTTTNVVTQFLNAGEQARLFAYVDVPSGVDINAASLVIQRRQ